MTLPYSKYYWRGGERIARANGLHVEETGGALARCVPFETATMSARLEHWPVEVRDDTAQYRLGVPPAPRFERGYVWANGEIRPATDGPGLSQTAYVVRSYAQVILIADARTGAIVWVNPARYSLTTGQHQCTMVWTGHDLRYPGCTNDYYHEHTYDVDTPSFNRGHGQPSLAVNRLPYRA